MNTIDDYIESDTYCWNLHIIGYFNQNLFSSAFPLTKQFLYKWIQLQPPCFISPNVSRLQRETNHGHRLSRPARPVGFLQEASAGRREEMFHSGSPQRRCWGFSLSLPGAKQQSQELLRGPSVCRGLCKWYGGSPVSPALPEKWSAEINYSLQKQFTAQDIQQGGFVTAPRAQHGDRPAVRHHVRPGGETLSGLRVRQDEYQGCQVSLLLLYYITGETDRVLTILDNPTKTISL